MEIKVGDIVQLKSGGPEMTVSRIIDSKKMIHSDYAYKDQGFDDGDAVCIWFRNDEPMERAFKIDTLDKVDD